VRLSQRLSNAVTTQLVLRREVRDVLPLFINMAVGSGSGSGSGNKGYPLDMNRARAQVACSFAARGPRCPLIGRQQRLLLDFLAVQYEWLNIKVQKSHFRITMEHAFNRISF